MVDGDPHRRARPPAGSMDRRGCAVRVVRGSPTSRQVTPAYQKGRSTWPLVVFASSWLEST
jgi:hypothetical protein